MRQILSFIFLSILSTSAFGQGVSIKITDDISEEVISDVTVTLNDSELKWVSDKNGVVTLTKRLQLDDSLHFDHEGYHALSLAYERVIEKAYAVQLSLNWSDLPPVVFIANNSGTDRKTSSSEIISISPKDIHLQNPQTTADLLNVSGKVFIQKSQLGGGSPMIRGMAANRVLIVVDGIRMNNAIFRGGNLQNIISIDANAVTGAEVLLGPGSVIYGTDAIGGVMSFRLKDPQFATDNDIQYIGSAMSRISSANRESTWHIDFEVRKKRISFLSSITLSNFNDLRMGSNGPEEYLRNDYVDLIKLEDSIIKNPNPQIQIGSGYTQFNLMQKVRWRPTDSLDVQGSFYYGTSSPIPRYDRLIQRTDDGSLRFGNWYYGPQGWLLGSVKATWDKKTLLSDKSRLSVAYQNFKESRLSRRFQVYETIERSENVNMFTFNLDLMKSLTNSTTLLYGLARNENYINSEGEQQNVFSGETQEIPSRYPDGSTWKSTSAYAKIDQQIGKNWDLEAGYRYGLIQINADLARSGFSFPNPIVDQQLTGQSATAGIVYHKDDVTTIRLNGSTGFRAPNIDDIGKIFDSEPGKVIVPNSDLKPENIYSLDLSIERKWSNRLLIQTNFFYSVLRDAIVRDNFTVNGADSIVYEGELSQVQSLVNAESATIYGAMIYADYKITSNWSISGTVNYTEGETSKGEAFRHVTPTFGSVQLNYSQRKWIVNLNTLFNGEIAYEDLAPSERGKPHIYAIDDNGNPYSPAWWTLNLKGQYRVSETLKLLGGVENILDKRYRTYSSGIVSPGINFYISARARF